MLVVKDSGKGLDPALLPRVFDRFWQAEAGAGRRFGGLGLGLAIVRHIVEAHGGTVRADSDGEGRGATFTVTVPIRAVAEETVASFASPLVAPAYDELQRLDGLHVLVVDDEPDARDLLATVLGARGARVRNAVNAAQALEALRDDRPDVLLSDVGMPSIDGYELLRRVRLIDDAHAAEVPAIAVTAYDRDDDRRRARNAGFQAHVAKPIDPAKLVAVVASLARASRQRATT